MVVIDFVPIALYPMQEEQYVVKTLRKSYQKLENLLKMALKKIVFCRIHIASFGLDLEGNWDLVRILEEVDKIPGIQRIRIGSMIQPSLQRGL